MNIKGATYGAVSGAKITWEENEIIVLNKEQQGEFAHLALSDYKKFNTENQALKYKKEQESLKATK